MRNSIYSVHEQLRGSVDSALRKANREAVLQAYAQRARGKRRHERYAMAAVYALLLAVAGMTVVFTP